jgi:hypothetical protein
MTVKTKALGSFEMSVTIQSDPWLMDITEGDDFPGLCDQKFSYKHVSDFGPLRSCGRLKRRK